MRLEGAINARHLKQSQLASNTQKTYVQAGGPGSGRKPGFVSQSLHDTLGRHGFQYGQSFPGGKNDATHVAVYNHQDGHSVRLDNGNAQHWIAMTNTNQMSTGHGQDALKEHIKNDYGYYGAPLPKLGIGKH